MAERLVFGWDVSTAIVGLAVFADGRYRESDHLDLRKVEGLNAKGDALRAFVDCTRRLCDPGSIVIHVVEDRLSLMRGGSNAGTMMTLAAFHGLARWFLHDTWRESAETSIVHPSTVKARMRTLGLEVPPGSDEKKALTLDFVRRREPTFAVDLNRNGKPQPWCYDRADAYITALAGQIIRGDQHVRREDPAR